jgi:hypothetical protein
MSIRHLIIASIATAGFSIAALAAPAIQLVPVATGSQAKFVYDHRRHEKAAAAERAPAPRYRHRRRHRDPLCPIMPWCWH